LLGLSKHLVRKTEENAVKSTIAVAYLSASYLFYDKNYLSLALSLRFLDEFVKKFLFFGICRGRITTPVPGAAR